MIQKSRRHCEERSPKGASDEVPKASRTTGQSAKKGLPQDCLSLRIASPAIKQRDRNDREKCEDIQFRPSFHLFYSATHRLCAKGASASGGNYSSTHLPAVFLAGWLTVSSPHRLIVSLSLISFPCICYKDEVQFTHALIQFVDNQSKIIMMYYNLFQQQWYTQNLVDAFNADEALWDELEARRKLRRTLCSLTEEEYKASDILEFEAIRPPDDCIGKPIVTLDEKKIQK